MPISSARSEGTFSVSSPWVMRRTRNSFSSPNVSITWVASTTDVRALDLPDSSSGLAATWYSWAAFTVQVDVPADGVARQVSLYLLDWDTPNLRAQRIDVLDPATGAVLDSREVSGFQNGVYLSWTVTTPVSFRISQASGWNVVLSGVFVD